VTNAVRIGVQRDGRWLGFDLRAVMRAVGPHADLRWFLIDVEFNCDVTPVWPEGNLAVQEASRQAQGFPLDWEAMDRLADTCSQIIDGRFVGYDQSGRPHLMLFVDDSTYWIVWATSADVLDSVRSAFSGVEDYPEPAPTDHH
jgi:hypothetical protein